MVHGHVCDDGSKRANNVCRVQPASHPDLQDGQVGLHFGKPYHCNGRGKLEVGNSAAVQNIYNFAGRAGKLFFGNIGIVDPESFPD